ncbi:MAG TPA: PDZ domain-containing protein, partial [Xanthomonadales bacterium]|nr:PDZ domain-containing protein [Xanthomonadales bacterium]
PWSGYTASHRHVVISVSPGSPAEEAGILPGDRIISIDGRLTERRAELRALGRGAIGETRTVGLQRSGQALETQLSYRQMPLTERIQAWLRVATALAFLAIGFLAWRERDGRMTRLLALAGMGFGLAFLPGPWSGPDWWRALLSAARTALVLAAIVAVVGFVARIPPRFEEKAGRGRLILLLMPAVALWVLLSVRSLFGGDSLDTLSLIAVGLVLSGYLLTATILFLRKYIRTAAEDRARRGLRFMLWGTLAGALPGLLGGFTLLGRSPFASYLFISAVLAPLSWAAVARKLEDSGSA